MSTTYQESWFFWRFKAFLIFLFSSILFIGLVRSLYRYFRHFFIALVFVLFFGVSFAFAQSGIYNCDNPFEIVSPVFGDVPSQGWYDTSNQSIDHYTATRHGQSVVVSWYDTYKFVGLVSYPFNPIVPGDPLYPLLHDPLYVSEYLFYGHHITVNCFSFYCIVHVVGSPFVINPDESLYNMYHDTLFVSAYFFDPVPEGTPFDQFAAHPLFVDVPLSYGGYVCDADCITSSGFEVGADLIVVVTTNASCSPPELVGWYDRSLFTITQYYSPPVTTAFGMPEPPPYSDVCDCKEEYSFFIDDVQDSDLFSILTFSSLSDSVVGESVYSFDTPLFGEISVDFSDPRFHLSYVSSLLGLFGSVLSVKIIATKGDKL